MSLSWYLNTAVSITLSCVVFVISLHFQVMHSENVNKKCRYKARWIWEYSAGEEYNIDGLDEIKFQVHAVNYPPIPLEQPEKPFAPMVITGTIDADGLGPVSWW
uniref:RNA polymerase III subunit Rpc25 domain-containing protein n=1 Tax=Rhizophora mucronata TaxID=61149 RepID=A0A2P2L9C9_RHIMU